MSGLVDGKVALVTGAASGIGRAAALTFAREGARVVLADLSAEPGEGVAAEIRSAGGEASFRHADLCDEEQVAELVGHCVEHFGRLDCAFNNAGITGRGGPIESIDRDEFERVLRANLLSVFLSMKHEIPVMREQGGGSIVNTSSGAGVLAVPGLSPYCASKHAILGLTKTAAVENARSGVRVNAVCPGAIDTPMLAASTGNDPELNKLVLRSQPGGRLGRPEEIAEAAVWLCSDRASFVSGESMLVDAAAVAR